MFGSSKCSYQFCSPLPKTPHLRNGSCYPIWFNSCACEGLDEETLSRSHASRWSAKTYRCCMTPTYCLDQATFTIFCCRDTNCCEGNQPFLLAGGCIPLLCYKATQIPCCLVAGMTAAAAWCAGSVVDGCAGPAEQKMEEEKSPLEKIKDSIKDNNLAETIKWIPQKNSNTILKMLAEDNVGLALLCLAIRDPNESVSLADRERLIHGLLRAGVPVTGKPLPEFKEQDSRFLNPLCEAMISEYSESLTLMKLLLKKIKSQDLTQDNCLLSDDKENSRVTSFLIWADRYYDTCKESQWPMVVKKMAELKKHIPKGNHLESAGVFFEAEKVLSSPFPSGVLHLIGLYSKSSTEPFTLPAVQTDSGYRILPSNFMDTLGAAVS